MTSREEFEKREESFLSPYGLPSSQSRGRVREEEACPIRSDFQRDRERIVYCNAFRRLKHKTQVFLSPLGEHYRTRLTHTLEVAQIARAVARAMRLNEDLTEAIALGHDLGHTPFGHSGETVLKEIYSGNFSHPIQSLRVIDILEKNGAGLNLTLEVRDGILKHSKGYGTIIPESKREKACTAEGQVVRVADIMAYLNHDLDDAIRSGVICKDQIPERCVRVLGSNHPERATTMVRDLIYASHPENGELKLQITDEVHRAMDELRNFLYHNVYRSPQVHNEFVKSKKILRELYTFFLQDANETIFSHELAALEMPNHNTIRSKERSVCDFIASITDRYALELYERHFFPSSLV
ncbi:deoxyguanosinetriphosphate triphosphohydrolase [Desulfoluna butyratoxydans]|uniref:Deoxyguanosinetriphosphate triphosphohydrolase-like protein n=1 Tax=Desulfoluna butyratoxydans TaxID=231438 RepID=A0A4V6IL67_9BACT|nr:deoxyguanosinetriphosphate triphosphohydrolase [Desulfoluna butyratoxydans]VFQ43978.1 dntp triphosphohydrolase [Desulfoluna butyratoxydans]